MSTIWTKNGLYQQLAYKSESELEAAIIQVQRGLFGERSIYLPVKKKIGQKGSRQNIPDGYLLDLRGVTPRLYVVENELAAHDPLRHVAVQILQFSMAFEQTPQVVKKVLLAALQDIPAAKTIAESYVGKHGYRNLDHLLEYLVFESPFAALVIIDQLVSDLENVLMRKFKFGVEVLELAQYQNHQGDRFYTFSPFLADLGGDPAQPDTVDVDVDTIVVPAWPDGFKEVFLGENRWHQIRIHGVMRPQIKYIAAYQTAPISAITHIAPVKSIEPWKDTGKYVVNFSETPRPIGPINVMKNGRAKALQNIRYASRARLLAAKTLDDVW